jgi:hypothetical protein
MMDIFVIFTLLVVVVFAAITYTHLIEVHVVSQVFVRTITLPIFHKIFGFLIFSKSSIFAVCSLVQSSILEPVCVDSSFSLRVLH